MNDERPDPRVDPAAKAIADGEFAYQYAIVPPSELEPEWYHRDWAEAALAAVDALPGSVKVDEEARLRGTVAGLTAELHERFAEVERLRGALAALLSKFDKYDPHVLAFTDFRLEREAARAALYPQEGQ